MKIAPSILGCDFANLKREADSVSAADYLHVDVMDGVFVPNISVGVPVVESLHKAVKTPLDVHLMITRPERYIEQFVKAGAAILTIHAEATEQIHECLRRIRELGSVPALCIKPATPADAVFEYLDDVGMVLVMTVEPGFGGQKLIPECLDKAAEIKKEILQRKLDVIVEADGGITPDNIRLVKEKGVDMAVVGSALFRADDRQAMIEELRRAAGRD